MKLTPLDIKRHRFEKGFRGYAPDEVDGFLKQVADQFESLLEELRLAHERTRETEGKLQHYERVELALQEALESAKLSGKRTQEDAERRAAVIVEEAELRAQQVLQDVERERYGMRQDLVKLSARQAEVAARLRGFLVSELQILSDFQGDEAHGLLHMDVAPPLLSDGSEMVPGEDEIRAEASAPESPEAPATHADDASWTDLADLVPPVAETLDAEPAETPAPEADPKPPTPSPASYIPPPRPFTSSLDPPAEGVIDTGRVQISSRADVDPEPLAPDDSAVLGGATPVAPEPPAADAPAPYPPPADAWASSANVAGSEAERERIRRILEDLD